jgi:uncharacterized protein with von Willebrand factor type A (vWA) domain
VSGFRGLKWAASFFFDIYSCYTAEQSRLIPPVSSQNAVEVVSSDLLQIAWPRRAGLRLVLAVASGGETECDVDESDLFCNVTLC